MRGSLIQAIKQLDKEAHESASAKQFEEAQRILASIHSVTLLKVAGVEQLPLAVIETHARDGVISLLNDHIVEVTVDVASTESVTDLLQQLENISGDDLHEQREIAQRLALAVRSLEEKANRAIHAGEFNQAERLLQRLEAHDKEQLFAKIVGIIPSDPNADLRHVVAQVRSYLKKQKNRGGLCTVFFIAVVILMFAMLLASTRNNVSALKPVVDEGKQFPCLKRLAVGVPLTYFFPPLGVGLLATCLKW